MIVEDKHCYVALATSYLVKANNSTQNWIITSGTDVGMNEACVMNGYQLEFRNEATFVAEC